MTSLHVDEFGTGPAVVFLHGAPTTVDSLAPLARTIEASHRCLMPHFPGYGKTPALDSEYTVARARRLLEEALIARGVTECVAVGLSLGAYRAFDLALAGRVRVTAILSLGGLAGCPPEMATAIARDARSGALEGEAFAALMMSDGYRAAHPEAKARVLAWLRATSMDTLAREMEAMARAEDLTPRLAGLDARVVARVGELDMAVPVAYSEVIARSAADGVLEVVTGVGHAIVDEDLEGTSASLRRLLGLHT